MNTFSHIRIIIYPASISLHNKEKEEIYIKISNFLKNWSAHGKPLTSSIKIEYNQFIIIFIDENIEPASGCSLDTLNEFMRTLDQEYQLGLFNRMKVCFIENNQVKTLPLQEFRKAVRSNQFSTDIQVFDFSKSDYQEFSSAFLLPLKESWAKDIL